MAIPNKAQDPFPTASALAPVFFAAGDPDFLLEVLGSHPLGVVLVEATAELTIVFCNESFERSVPMAGRSVLGTRLLDLFEPADRKSVRAAHRQVVLSGRPCQWRRSPAVGQARSLNLYPVRGSTGAVTHVLGLAADAAGPRAAQARMQATQERVVAALTAIAEHLGGKGDLPAFFGRLTGTIAELVGASKAAFWRYDPETQAVILQPDAYGMDAAEAAAAARCAPEGENLPDRVVFGDPVLVTEFDAEDAEQTPCRAQIDEIGAGDSICIPWRTGTRRLGVLGVFGSTRPSGFTQEDVWVLQAAGAAAAIVWEHKQADDALAELRDREAAGLREKIDQSLQLERLKTNVLKLASHELRGPLGIIRGYFAMLEDGTIEPAEVVPILPVLHSKLNEMSRLIDEILETSRLEARAGQLNGAPVDLRELAGEAVRALEPLATPKHRLATSVPEAPVLVRADRSRLLMVLTTLVHNAIKYSPDGGEVRVVCTADDRTARVDVSDQGIGIAPADRDRLFTSSGRILTERTTGIPGTGLGLYLARDQVRRQGGDIEVDSEPGRGSTFTLRLPLAQLPARDEERRPGS